MSELALSKAKDDRRDLCDRNVCEGAPKDPVVHTSPLRTRQVQDEPPLAWLVMLGDDPKADLRGDRRRWYGAFDSSVSSLARSLSK